MALTVQDYASLTDDLQEVFDETAESSVAEMKMPSIFQVRDIVRRTYDMTIRHGLAGVAKVTPGQELPTVSGNEGDSITFTQAYYGAKCSITKEMRLFDLYDQMEDEVRSIIDDAFQKVEQSMADVLGFGWSTSYSDVYSASQTSTGPDGLALFSTVHTNNTNADTYRNQIKDDSSTENPALSRAAIVQARADAMGYVAPTGVIRPTRLDTLIVSPTKEDLAFRIVNSSGVATTPNVDDNPLRGNIKIIVAPHLTTRTGGTNTSAYWYMADSKKVGNSLRAIFAQRPQLGAAENVTETQNWLYPIDFFYTLGRGYQQYIWGSNASLS